MEKKNNMKAWLYLLPSLFFIIIFMIYPLVDVFIYAFEENYESINQTYTGIGFENFIFIFTEDEDGFVQSLWNTLLLVVITVPISTILALAIAAAINAIKPLQKLFQIVFFLPYVTNAIAVGTVFMVMFQSTATNAGLINTVLGWFGIPAAEWLAGGEYWRQIFVLSTYIIWNVMPFKVIVLIGALQSVKKEYYEAAQIDGASRGKKFRRITIPLISPMIFYLVITGFIGAFKEYSNVVGIFGQDGMRQENLFTVVGRIYYYLYSTNTFYGAHPSYAAAAAIVLFCIVMFITCINLLISKRNTQY